MRTRRNLNDNALSYVKDTFLSPDPFLDFVRGSLSKDEIDIQLSQLECQFLNIIIKMAKVKRVLEIGTCVGYSALFMAKNLPSDGLIVTIEKDELRADLASKHFKGFEKIIHLYKGDAVDVIPTLERYSPFDMVFIDAQKSMYLSYLMLIEKFLIEGSIIVADNTLLFDTIYDESFFKKKSWQNMREFNKYLGNNPNYTSTLIPVLGGMTVAVKLS